MTNVFALNHDKSLKIYYFYLCVKRRQNRLSDWCGDIIYLFHFCSTADFIMRIFSVQQHFSSCHLQGWHTKDGLSFRLEH